MKTALTTLEASGVIVTLVDGRISIDAGGLDPDRREGAFQYAKDHREAILDELSNRRIMPTTICQDGRPCKHLYAPGGRNPVCRINGTDAFTLSECPSGKWWMPNKTPKERRLKIHGVRYCKILLAAVDRHECRIGAAGCKRLYDHCRRIWDRLPATEQERVFE